MRNDETGKYSKIVKDAIHGFRPKILANSIIDIRFFVWRRKKLNVNVFLNFSKIQFRLQFWDRYIGKTKIINNISKEMPIEEFLN